MNALFQCGRAGLFALCALAGCGHARSDAGAGGAGGSATTGGSAGMAGGSAGMAGGSAGMAGGSAGMAGSGEAAVGSSFHWLEPLAAHVQLAEQSNGQAEARTESRGATANASVVAGESTVLSASNLSLSRSEAFRWTEATGSVSLGTIPGLDPATSQGLMTEVRDMSVEGNVIAGVWSSAGSQGGFRWTTEAGMEALVAPSGTTISDVYQVSADGSVVVGSVALSNGHAKAFRWTSVTGVVVLDGPAGSTDSQVTWLSADGATVVGNAWDSNGGQAFRWTQATGATGLGLLANFTKCYSQQLPREASGLAIIGSCGAETNVEAFRWTQASGIENLGTLPGHSSYEASNVSADGKVVTGGSVTSDGNTEVFYWSEVYGMVGLGFLPGGTSSYSRPLSGLSADGAVVSGDSDDSQGHALAFRWTQASGMRELAPLATYDVSSLLSMSADGATYAGSSMLREPGMDPTAGPDAAFWDANGNVSSLAAKLTSGGVNLGAGKLQSVAVSRDGSVLLGTGLDADGHIAAFVARLQ